ADVEEAAQVAPAAVVGEGGAAVLVADEQAGAQTLAHLVDDRGGRPDSGGGLADLLGEDGLEAGDGGGVAGGGRRRKVEVGSPEPASGVDAVPLGGEAGGQELDGRVVAEAEPRMGGPGLLAGPLERR